MKNVKWRCKFNLKHRECLPNHPSQRLMIKCLTIIQIELEFGNAGFWVEGKTGVPGEKPLGARKKTDNKLNPLMTPGLGIEPGTNWWEASALTTAPSLFPKIRSCAEKLRPIFGKTGNPFTAVTSRSYCQKTWVRGVMWENLKTTTNYRWCLRFACFKVTFLKYFWYSRFSEFYSK